MPFWFRCAVPAWVGLVLGICVMVLGCGLAGRLPDHPEPQVPVWVGFLIALAGGVGCLLLMFILQGTGLCRR